MLEKRIEELQQQTNSITNRVLSAFDLEECKIIDKNSINDNFIRNKRNSCIKLLKELGIDYSPKYNSAFEEYNEAIIYLDLKKKYTVKPIPETAQKTPDFRIKNTNSDMQFDIFGELKTLSYVDGSLNYVKAQKRGLEAQIELKEQMKEGKKFAFSTTVVSPLHKSGTENRDASIKYIIERYIDKINQNVKAKQYSMGDTILIVDIKQLLLPSFINQSAMAIFQEQQHKSLVSGVLWNTAFGKVGNQIYKQIWYEGNSNMDDTLEKEGILIKHKYIKALVFAVYKNFNKRKYIGFYRHKEQDEQVLKFLIDFCEFTNDDLNTQSYKILQGEHPSH